MGPIEHCDHLVIFGRTLPSVCWTRWATTKSRSVAGPPYPAGSRLSYQLATCLPISTWLRLEVLRSSQSPVVWDSIIELVGGRKLQNIKGLLLVATVMPQLAPSRGRGQVRVVQRLSAADKMVSSSTRSSVRRAGCVEKRLYLT